jgi:hypothetical protein
VVGDGYLASTAPETLRSGKGLGVRHRICEGSTREGLPQTSMTAPSEQLEVDVSCRRRIARNQLSLVWRGRPHPPGRRPSHSIVQP